MGTVRIFQPTKNAMQSGRANLATWVLEFDASDAKRPDPLMGWVGSADTATQVRMKFPSRDAAVAFAEKRGLGYTVVEPKTRRIKPKNYADIFAFDRVEKV